MLVMKMLAGLFHLPSHLIEFYFYFLLLLYIAIIIIIFSFFFSCAFISVCGASDHYQCCPDCGGQGGEVAPRHVPH